MNYEIIKEYVQVLKEKYGFNGLLHFTDFSNLMGIFEKGCLHSRKYCLENNIKVIKTEFVYNNLQI
jgi:hypothetical protein